MPRLSNHQAIPYGKRIAFALIALLLLLPAAVQAQATPVADAPVPVTFPTDDGPHDALVEWWYYTGHLFADSGRYGFELVVFKAVRGGITGYVSHFAVTDNARSTFRYDQLAAVSDSGTPRSDALQFDLRVADWRVAGGDGRDRLKAEMAGYAIDLRLESQKPPALHDGDGYIDYGYGEASYYYSRTRISVSGELTVDGMSEPVTGQAWFDHQWGDFGTFEDGGWDWFAIQLGDGADLMLYVITTLDRTPVVVDGSYVAPDGSLTILEEGDFTIIPTGTWTSPATGVTYPSGWSIAVSDLQLDLVLSPSLPDQELDTRSTTGIIYWEGEVLVSGSNAGNEVTGYGYVELTGYADRDS